MIKNTNRTRWRLIAAGAMLSWPFLSMTAAVAGELQSLAWDGDVLNVKTSEPSAYQVQRLEDGKRLRLQLPGTKLSPTITDIEGQGPVKGVYPYPAENGSAVYIDFLLTEPGNLRVEQAPGGYRVNVAVGADEGTPAPNSAAGTASAPAAAAPDAAEPPSPAGATGANTIQDISYAALPGNRLQIRLKMAKTPEQPAAFTVTNPPSVSLDFQNTKLDLPRKTVKIGTGAVVSVTAVESDNRSRVVLKLVKPVAYSAHVEEGGLSLIVENPVSAIVGTQAPKTTRFATAQKGGKFAIKGVDFRRGVGGEGKVVIDLSDPRVGVNIYEQAGEIIVDFLDTSVSQELQRRLDVVDFATPIDTVDTFALGKNTRMVIKPHGKYEHSAYQAGNVFTVNVKPVVVSPEEEAARKADEFGYSGEKLSLNFQNIDVRAALQVIADFTNLNFVTSDTVKGSLTLRLKDVPWDQALDIIVSAKNLAVRRKGNVVVVAPADEVAAKEKAQLEASKAASDLEPLVSELIQINYSKAGDIAALLKSIKAVGVPTTVGRDAVVSVAKVETESNTLLSPRGQVTVDARTNSILVQDTAGKIREIRKLIAKLDQPVRQVMIEARLVEASERFSRNLGVRFGTTNNVTGSGLNVNQAATLEGSNLNVNFPVFGGGNLALTIAKLGTATLLNLELSALEQSGNGKIISSPRLITASQKKARIEQGEERSVITVDGLQTKRAVLGLEVTPQITPDDRIILDVDITKDNFINSQDLLLATKRMNTQVLLDNGETVVIGGVYEQNELNNTAQVPYFGDVPLFGWLFKTKSVTDTKTELLIFLTPRVLSPALSLH